MRLTNAELHYLLQRLSPDEAPHGPAVIAKVNAELEQRQTQIEVRYDYDGQRLSPSDWNWAYG